MEEPRARKKTHSATSCSNVGWKGHPSKCPNTRSPTNPTRIKNPRETTTRAAGNLSNRPKSWSRIKKKKRVRKEDLQGSKICLGKENRIRSRARPIWGRRNLRPCLLSHQPQGLKSRRTTTAPRPWCPWKTTATRRRALSTWKWSGSISRHRPGRRSQKR